MALAYAFCAGVGAYGGVLKIGRQPSVGASKWWRQDRYMTETCVDWLNVVGLGVWEAPGQIVEVQWADCTWVALCSA